MKSKAKKKKILDCRSKISCLRQGHVWVLAPLSLSCPFLHFCLLVRPDFVQNASASASSHSSLQKCYSFFSFNSALRTSSSLHRKQPPTTFLKQYLLK
ncbi:hypothetical protein V6N11_017719 [Hibiscus sabdariffa]|uniref:Uncharacterized protein n=1 Tax=Hibiscus sabdariffa TaxID=183260 RepID=A0ABR2TZI3_9ROSI